MSKLINFALYIGEISVLMLLCEYASPNGGMKKSIKTLGGLMFVACICDFLTEMLI